MILSSDAYITRERVRFFGFLFVVLTAVTVALTLATAHGSLDMAGRPIGTDFSAVWTAGKLARIDQPGAAFNILPHAEMQRAQFGTDVPIFGWHYPPPFLLVAERLAALPYLQALLVYQSATLLLYVLAMRRIAAPLAWREWLWPVLGFPAVWVNIMHGHTGFLSAALFGGGLALLPARPVLAGLLLGALSYKPQFGVLIPLALLAGGQWRAFISATLCTLALAGLSIAAYGADIWETFLRFSAFTRHEVLESGSTGWYKIQTPFAALRLWDAPLGLAYAGQAAVTLGVAYGVWRVWRSRAEYAYKAALLLIGSLLATPYALDYDLMLLAPALAFLTVQGVRYGFAPYAPSLLAFAWLMPIGSRMTAQYTGIPLGYLTLFALFLFVARHARDGAALSTS